MAEDGRSTSFSPSVTESGKKSRADAPQSRASGKVTFPASARSQTTGHQSLTSATSNGHANPFHMPSDNDIFTLRDKERQRKKQERIRQRTLHVQDKTTYATRVNFKTASMIRPADSEAEDDEQDVDDGRSVAVKDDPQFTLSVTRDRHVEKESLADYITKKREMFLVQYSLGVKRDEMRKLEEIASAEEKKLELAERYLEEDAAMFDEFLKENDKNSVEAIKIAEAETKAKLEKVAEIKKINAQMMAIRSEISKYEDTLKEYQLYKGFLEALTPKDWLDEQREKKRKRREEKRKLKIEEMRKRGEIATPTSSERSTATRSRKSRGGARDASRSSASMKKSGPSLPGDPESAAEMTESDSDSDEEPQLYFDHPQQLLDIFAELEEQNLSLIQNSQETEETLEEMKQTIKQTQNKMEKETHILKDQIDKLNNAINKEEEKASDLETKARLFSFGEFKAEDQEKMLAALNRKVEEVYKSCIGENDANITTLQMLTNIENRLEELFEMIEMMPQDKVEAAEKAKEKERRLRQREEKQKAQQLKQEERVQKALERAKAEPKKQTGRKLVPRSEPPELKKKTDNSADLASREEEELAYYFSP